MAEQAHPGAPTRTLRPPALDVTIAVVFTTVALIVPIVTPRGDHHAPSVWGVLALAAAFALLLLRRVRPLLVLAVSVVGSVVLMAMGDERNVLLPVAVVVVFTVASETDRRTAWIAGGTSAIVLFVTGLTVSTGSWLGPENVGIIAWTGMATAAGDAIRSRRAYVAAVEERARRAEQTREEEARRQVVEERLRIARELHDVLAHHIALINVQASVATHVLREQPDRAEEALGHVRRAGRAVLDELSALLNVLRESEDGAGPMEPAPGLDRLPHLFESFSAAGLRVESAVEGAPRPLPAAVDLAAYRVVQEALTNVHKHGGGARARLRFSYTDEELHIEVSNVGGTVRSGSGDGARHGIVGMRERALSVGGWLVAGPADRVPFQLRASLPAPWQGGAHGDPGTAGR